MKVTTERTENCQVILDIEVDEERVERHLRNAARRISQKVRIPGFRKGKVPYRVVLRRFGKEALYDEAVDELSQDVFKEALKESGIKPFAQARIEDVQWEPTIFKMVVPVGPMVELGDYREMRVEPEEVTVSDEQVEEVLKDVQKSNVEVRPVQRPAQLGDIGLVDIEARVGGEVVLSNKEQNLHLMADSPDPLSGFSEKLVGMSIGEHREFTLTYPEDWSNPDLAGKEAHFSVHLHELKEEILPALDDDLAKSVGDYETLDELRAKVRENLRTQAQQEAEERFAAQVLEEAVRRARVEFPLVLLEQEIDDMVAEQDRILRQQQGLTLKNYLQTIKKSEEDFRADLRSQAEERLKKALVLNEVIEVEGLKIESDEVETEIERLSLPYGEHAEKVREFLSSPDRQVSIKLDLLKRKALDRLVAIAKDEAPEVKEEKPLLSEEDAALVDEADEGAIEKRVAEGVSSAGRGEEKADEPGDGEMSSVINGEAKDPDL